MPSSSAPAPAGSLVPIALGLGLFHAALAVLGFDVMRYVLRIVLPVSLAFTGVLLALYLTTDDSRFDAGRVFSSPDQHPTWAGFATYVTVMAGASLTLVPSVADFCRYMVLAPAHDQRARVLDISWIVHIYRDNGRYF